MKNNFKNNDLSSSVNNSNSLNNSFESYPRNFKFINRKRKVTYIGNNIFHKINKIQKRQDKTNQKLDLILFYIKSKMLGEYEYNISHYDFCIPTLNKFNIKINDNENKEEKDLNIKDDFGVITIIKKEPYNPPENIYRKEIKKEKDNKNNSTGNLNQIINDFLYQNKNEKSNQEEDEHNNKKRDNINNNFDDNIFKNNDNNNNNKINDNINNESPGIKKEIENNKILNNKNANIFDDINKNINSLLNNLNKSYKKDIDLNKYKFEPKKDINSNINKNINDSNKNDLIILNNEKNDIINNCNKDEIKEETKNNENFEDNFENNENININEERKNMDNNLKEEEKEAEKKSENYQSDTMSVKSMPSSSSSGKKSNQGSSRKIRGFNFRNNIKIKKYNGKKFGSSSSSNEKEKK